jgi:hypothetical protein
MSWFNRKSNGGNRAVTISDVYDGTNIFTHRQTHKHKHKHGKTVNFKLKIYKTLEVVSMLVFILKNPLLSVCFHGNAQFLQLKSHQ